MKDFGDFILFPSIYFLGIRHPEELSLLKPVEEKKKKKDKDSVEEEYDLTDVPLTSGISHNCVA